MLGMEAWPGEKWFVGLTSNRFRYIDSEASIRQAISPLGEVSIRVQ